MNAPKEQKIEDIVFELNQIGDNARASFSILAKASTEQKNTALLTAADEIKRSKELILNANEKDILTAKEANIATSFVDRLKLNSARIDAIAAGLEAVAGLPDPVGETISEWKPPNGLNISRVRVPLGVIGIIYESRPNVTADAGALCVKSGNAAILRGGSDSFYSSRAIWQCLVMGLAKAGLPEETVQLVPTTDRTAVGELLKMSNTIDIIVPRGGKSLIERVQAESRIPVIAHLEGLCHTYIDRHADLNMAKEIIVNAKMRRTGICGATETLLIDNAAADRFLPPIIDALAEAGCELRGDEKTQRIDERVRPAKEIDWKTEYLNSIISIRHVNGVNGAIKHIATYGSKHTDAIITNNSTSAEKFLTTVDSAIVMHNTSTQFADGGEFGMGAEIGISTGRLHARGPVGVEQLTTYKYVVRGAGQVRP